MDQHWISFGQILKSIKNQTFVGDTKIPSDPGVYWVRIQPSHFRATEKDLGPREVIDIGSAQDLRSRLESVMAGALGLHVYHSTALRMIQVRGFLHFPFEKLECIFKVTPLAARKDEENKAKSQFKNDLNQKEAEELLTVRKGIKSRLPDRNLYPADKLLPILVAR